jgi:hypothetical protein
MTMLSTTGEHVVYVIMFWLVQLEVSLCEDMFGSLDGRSGTCVGVASCTLSAALSARFTCAWCQPVGT